MMAQGSRNNKGKGKAISAGSYQTQTLDLGAFGLEEWDHFMVRTGALKGRAEKDPARPQSDAAALPAFQVDYSNPDLRFWDLGSYFDSGGSSHKDSSRMHDARSRSTDREAHVSGAGGAGPVWGGGGLHYKSHETRSGGTDAFNASNGGNGYERYEVATLTLEYFNLDLSTECVKWLRSHPEPTEDTLKRFKRSFGQTFYRRLPIGTSITCSTTGHRNENTKFLNNVKSSELGGEAMVSGAGLASGSMGASSAVANADENSVEGLHSDNYGHRVERGGNAGYSRSSLASRNTVNRSERDLAILWEYAGGRVEILDLIPLELDFKIKFKLAL
ncbi:hypothetical protein QBC47DRAFT_391664 [Echria macrotheca]|uniref:Uncharacterized protein n=1 Tax=Echria macrotheca TaxID=438768 RepID=A0AAJ0B505_9PEZI|nr:hypothetical protein QBC47DRAFT_391664 [Echria macrotheca]